MEWATHSSGRRRYGQSETGWKICAEEPPSCPDIEAPDTPFKGTVGAATYPVAGGATIELVCEEPYVKSGDFMCEGGPFSKEGCGLFDVTSGDCKVIKYEPPAYVIIESGTCGDDYVITEQTICDEAAAALGLSDTTSSTSYSTYGKPQGCTDYYDDLYVYEGTDDCSSYNKCICKNSVIAPDTACVASPNYPLEYSPDSACSIMVTAPSFVNAVVFDTHSSASGRDFVKLGTAEYEGTTGPSNQIAAAGTNLMWVADDDSNVGNGWVICAEVASPCVAGSEPSAPAQGTVGAYAFPVASGETVSLECASPHVKTADFMCIDGTFSAPVCTLIEKESGDCAYDGGCVTSPNYPEQYDHSKQCSFTIKAPMMVTAEAFDASADDDYPEYLTLGDVRYSQTTGPSNVFVAAGATMEWAPNSSPRRRYSSYSPSGWKICAGESPSCEQSDAPTAPFKGTVGAATYPVAGGATVGLECESPYVKSGDFMCEGGPFSKEGCSLFAITSGDCKHIVYEAPRYVVIESGTCGDDYVIQDQTTCDEAATALGLSDTTSYISSSTYNRPKGCAWSYSSLYIYDVTSECSSSYKCICKNSASSPKTACVASPNYPLKYSPNSACSITIA